MEALPRPTGHSSLSSPYAVAVRRSRILAVRGFVALIVFFVTIAYGAVHEPPNDLRSNFVGDLVGEYTGAFAGLGGLGPDLAGAPLLVLPLAATIALVDGLTLASMATAWRTRKAQPFWPPTILPLAVGASFALVATTFLGLFLVALFP